MILQFANFVGMKPEINDKLLPQNFALQATNTFTDDGTLNTWRDLLFDVNLAKTGTIKTIYKMVSGTWLQWNSTEAATGVKVARAPIANNSSERLIFTGTDAPRYTDAAKAIAGGGTSYPTTSFLLKIPTPTNVLTVTVSQNTPTGIQFQYSIAGTVDDSIGNRIARTYVYTFVTSDGVEGAPSEPSDIAYSNTDEKVTLANFPGMPVGAYDINRYRIYRSIGTGSYLLVAEVPIITTTYVDTVADSALGGELPSTLWSPPPDTLTGVVAMANGMLAGYVGNDLYFSEPYQAQGWPEDYIKSLDYPITGVASAGNMLFVATQGYPYVAIGSHPSVIQLNKLDSTQSCLSLRSLVDIEQGAMYASIDGLVLLGQGQAQIVTQQVISERFWRQLNPSSMHGYFYRNKYFGFYDSGSTGTLTMETGEKVPAKGGFIYDHARSALTFTDVTCDAAFSDKVTGTLYLVKNVGGVNKLYKWDGATTNLTLTWTSKTMVIAECNMAAARVDAKRYPVWLKIYGDGQLVATQYVTNQEVFRLPSGYRARQWQIEVTGDAIVQGVFVATSIRELKL